MRTWEDWGRKGIAAAALAAALWFGAKALLGLLAPFFAAFALAAAMESAVKLLVRRGMPRRTASARTTLFALGLIGALLWLLAGRLSELLSVLGRAAPRLVAALGEKLNALEEHAARFAASMPGGFPDPLRAALKSAPSALGELPAQLSARLLALAAGAMQNAPGILLFLISLFLGAYLFSSSYPAVIAFVRARLPETARRRAAELAEDLRGSLGGWLRAQLILAGLCFVELLGLFVLLGLRSAAPLAAVTAFIDALPVFGAGIVLVPWALAELLLGELGRGLALLFGWAVGALGRNLLQARLLSGQIGIHPLVSLVSIYVGWRVWGVWGMIVFPLLFAMGQRLVERGLLAPGLFRDAGLRTGRRKTRPEK
ncbi:MAG: AI-2E family transporter [Oscillospiraceae bacterium]|nr:AI-2E family transporter [Oscillospiraceae bacterium]